MESFIMRTFEHAGKINQTHIGNFKPKASKKNQKRTLYSATVVFKHAEALEQLANPAFLQGKINKIAKKQLRF